MVARAISKAVPRRARGAVTSAFAVHGLISAAWLPRIPQIKEHLGLGAGVFGVALLGAPLGVACAVRAAGWCVARWGSRAVVLGAGSVASVAPFLVALSGNLGWLLAALLLFGASLGLMDVAMNAQGVAVERAYRRPIMSGLHGSYSVGALASALAGSAAAQARVPVPVHLAVASAVVLCLLWTFCRPLLDRSAEVPSVASGPPRSVRAHRAALFMLGVIALCSFVGEGAMGDWSAVYLRETLGTGPGAAGLGYAGCAVAMTAGRVAGDRVVARFGAVAVLRAGSLVAACGLGAGLLARDPVAAVAGFTLFGLGVAVVAPVTFSAAGNLPGVPAAAGISRVTALGYLGLLGGPPVIGFVAEGVGLGWALGVPVVLAGTIAVLAGAVSSAGR
ncbi:Inner membrane protein YbjJ [Actinomadura rubteroloni]|uniref:Inner membrane protein YbjJ n=1 Tax=Actinomadura rubteroloni TaxID=1926885 RepID=A0A2P4UGU4_9ACTN|nr:MFS transporter [Actinomadura rubteroloni]POM24294.1 Inner membrane protein YbjJ [Actinomadura rubteroloni]